MRYRMSSGGTPYDESRRIPGFGFCRPSWAISPRGLYVPDAFPSDAILKRTLREPGTTQFHLFQFSPIRFAEIVPEKLPENVTVFFVAS